MHQGGFFVQIGLIFSKADTVTGEHPRTWLSVDVLTVHLTGSGLQCPPCAIQRVSCNIPWMELAEVDSRSRIRDS